MGNVLMPTFVEATLLLFPPDAGGRTAPIAPREGSYRPFARYGPHVTRACLFEGPALLAPGEADRVMLELDADLDAARGEDLQILELDERIVGLATVLRVCTR